MSQQGESPGINADRLWSTLEASSKIGATPAGGLRRLALSEEDRDMRDLLASWARDSGYEVRVDRLGNMFVRRPGTAPEAPPVLLGSHLDTQAKGGRYDGILGVLAGLEVLRSLDDQGIATARSVEVVNWSNEEGARFQPPMMCSLVFAGGASVEWALNREDKSGIRFGEALERIGYAGTEAVGERTPDSYLELHIEQGPVLDESREDVGIVTSAYAMKGMRIEVLGQTSHVGPTPMEHRKNALVGAAYVAVAVNEMGWRYAQEDGKSSVARIDVSPNLPGLLSDEAQLYIDFRHPDPARLEAMTAEVEEALSECATKSRTDIRIAERWGFGGLRFDRNLADLLKTQARQLGIEFREMASQAGHDAYHLSEICPTVMIFSPCRGGITHNEAEDVDWERTIPAVQTALPRSSRASGEGRAMRSSAPWHTAMRPLRTYVALGILCSVLPFDPSALAGQAVDVRAFLQAESEEDRQEAVQALTAAGHSPEAVYRALEAGRSYEAGVPTGRVESARPGEGDEPYRYFFVVPESYDPTRRYPVRVYLHGGVSRPARGVGGDWWARWERLASEDHISVFPQGWGEAMWWTGRQVENLRQILSELKRAYNVDEDRVTLTGVSDGGTGAYYVGMKDPTPWAAFFPFIGSPGVLLNPRVGAEGGIHLGNLINTPLYIVNGETDRLYPVRRVEPYLRSFSEAGVPFEFHPQPGGHDTAFWPDLADNIDEFHANFPRDAHPERVVWATEDASHFPRAHWIVVDEVGHIAGDDQRATLAGLTENGQAAVVDARRGDNSVRLHVYHAPRVRILISPAVFDLTRPISVVFNGTEVFSGTVQPSLETLLKWAARDDDRTMLYLAELEVTAPGSQ